MPEGQLLMTQAERDRLITLKKAKKQLMKQQAAADELRVSLRHVRRLLMRLKEEGDKSVIHGLKGKPSQRRIGESTEREAVKILSADVYRGFGPTLASEYLRDEHGIDASKETVRQWMLRGQLWRAKRDKVVEVHLWRPRRSRFGEMVQWDTSEHDWLEGRGEEKLYLVAMIDDATSRLWARFAPHDSTAENMRLLWSYVEKFGRPLLFYTDKAGLFKTAEKRRRDEPGVDKDAVEMPPTQIGRALKELGIAWSAARSPQAKGRVERNFGTAQDRLVKGMRKAGVNTLAQANQYLQEQYLVWWEREMTVEPGHAEDAHRPLDQSHSLAAALSHVETRQVRNDYTLRFEAQLYQIERKSIVNGLRGSDVRVEKRLDGSLAVRFGERYLVVTLIAEAPAPSPPPAQRTSAAAINRKRPSGKKSGWMKDFLKTRGPSIKKAIAISNATN
jgi:transposase